MTVRFRSSAKLLDRIHEDLARPHPFAAERVGFVLCSSRSEGDIGLLLVANRWISVEDTHYVDDPRVGACIGPSAFRSVLQMVYSSRESIVHVHRHEHRGVPSFSRVDMSSMRDFVPSFFNAAPHVPHGAIVLSYDAVTGAIWVSRDAVPRCISQFHIVDSQATRVERS